MYQRLGKQGIQECNKNKILHDTCLATIRSKLVNLLLLTYMQKS